MAKGRPSEKGVHPRCIVIIEGVQCPRTDVVSYGVCGPHDKQRSRGRAFTPVRFYRPQGMSDSELAKWILEVSPESSAGCKLWPFALNNPSGYGVISVGWGHERRRTSPHRLVATHFLNEGVRLLREQVVHHMCSVRRCVNPEHLTITTAAHNASEAQMSINNRILTERVEYLERVMSECESCGAERVHGIQE